MYFRDTPENEGGLYSGVFRRGFRRVARPQYSGEQRGFSARCSPAPVGAHRIGKPARCVCVCRNFISEDFLRSMHGV